MALQILEAAAIFDPETAALRYDLGVARAAGNTVLPQLVGISTHADHGPIRHYQNGLRRRAARIYPDGTLDADGYQLFRTIDCEDEYQALRAMEELANQPGVGILLFTPLKDEKLGEELGLISAIPDAQNVDGQAERSVPEPQTSHIPGTVQSCLRLLKHARREYGGLETLETVAVIGDGAAVGRRAKIELRKLGIEVVNITLEENKERLTELGAFDAVIAAAGGSPEAAEIIKPDFLRNGRLPGSRRPPLVVIDAAYEFPVGENDPQGNLDRIFRKRIFQDTTDINAIVAPIGVVSKGAQTEVFANTFNVPSAQQGFLGFLAFAADS